MRLLSLVLLFAAPSALAIPPMCEGPIGGCDFEVEPCDGEVCGAPDYQLTITCPNGEGSWTPISHMEAIEWCR